MIRNGRKIGHGGLDLGPADPPAIYGETPEFIVMDDPHGDGDVSEEETRRLVSEWYGLSEAKERIDALTFAENDQPAIRLDTDIPSIDHEIDVIVTGGFYGEASQPATRSRTIMALVALGAVLGVIIAAVAIFLKGGGL